MSVAHGYSCGLPAGMSVKLNPWLLMTNANSWPSQADVETPDSGADGSNACKDSLLSVIERQIIPRLLQSHPAADELPELAAKALKHPSEEHVQAYAQACLAPEAATSQVFLVEMKQQGYSLETIFLHLLAPAARYLGLQWELDTMDFSQVTLGLVRIHEHTHELGYAYRDGPQAVGARRRIMLASAPGSQHILGLTIVSEFFRKERWQVVVEISSSREELAHAVSNEWFDMLGLSVSVVEQLPSIPALIRNLREKSRNPEVKVLLGGPAFLVQPMQALELGADGLSLDAAEAVVLASGLLPAWIKD
jgi:methanogenic corrinoid protein MtbC1